MVGHCLDLAQHRGLVAGHTGVYGIYAFNSKGGTMSRSEAFANNEDDAKTTINTGIEKLASSPLSPEVLDRAWP